MSASTAKVVLSNCSLRWSSPVLFNDPLDVPRELAFGIVAKDFIRAGASSIADIINNPPEDTSNLMPHLQMLAEAARRGLPEDVKQQMLASLIESMETLNPSDRILEEMRTVWRQLIKDMRILCLTESPSHIAMWYHYADKYRGVVIEFRCVDELASAWLIAKPVRYPEEKPEVYTAHGWVKIMSMPNQDGTKAMMDIAMSTKSPDWSYEKEWRLSSFKRPEDTGDFTDYRFHKQELGAIYLGPMICEKDAQELTAIAQQYPAAKIIKVAVGMSRELEFHAVGG